MPSSGASSGSSVGERNKNADRPSSCGAAVLPMLVREGVTSLRKATVDNTSKQRDDDDINGGSGGGRLALPQLCQGVGQR